MPFASILRIAPSIVLAGLMGCNDAPPPRGVVSHEQPRDIPVPAGFVFIRDASFSFEAGRFQKGTYVWHGGGRIADVALFYRKRLPSEGWTAVAEKDLTEPATTQSHIMLFEKQFKTLRIIISPLPKTVPRRIQVVLKLDPRN